LCDYQYDQETIAMPDAASLSAMGLSDADASDFVQKYQNFLSSLNANQIGLLNRWQPPTDKAAAAVAPGCTVDDLNKFVAARCTSALVPHAQSVPTPTADCD
jgi:hypothetical protein